jgi:hypothetical protein
MRARERRKLQHGFLSGAAGKKMGLTPESTKREDGERIPKIASVARCIPAKRRASSSAPFSSPLEFGACQKGRFFGPRGAHIGLRRGGWGYPLGKNLDSRHWLAESHLLRSGWLGPNRCFDCRDLPAASLDSGSPSKTFPSDLTRLPVATHLKLQRTVFPGGVTSNVHAFKIKESKCDN